jgi:hypothetical protein
VEDAGLMYLVRGLKDKGWSNEEIMEAITASVKIICAKLDKEKAGG